MHRVNTHRRWIPEFMILVVLQVLARRWIREAAIVALMLGLLLVELGLRLRPGSHTVAHVVVWGLLFGLIAMWVCVNRTALAAWEQQDTEERDRQC
jgi:hypothetical protein